MKYFGCISLLFVVLTAQANPVDLPNGFQTCQRGIPNFSECIEKAADEAVASLAEGSESLEIPPIEPMIINSVTIAPANSTVSLNQVFKNVRFHGFTRGFKSSNFKVDFDRLSIRFETFNPQVDFVGNFSIKGTVFFIPIQSHGYSNVSFVGLRTKQTIHCEKYEKENETFLRIKKYDIKIKSKDTLLDFTDLSEKKGPLGNTTMAGLKKNSKLIFGQLRPSYEKTFSRIFTNIAKKVFEHIPMDKLFPY